MELPPPATESGQVQPLGFVDDRLKNLLRHFRIEAAALRPCLALREHGLAVTRIADTFAVVLELQRCKCELLPLSKQFDEIAVKRIDCRAYIGEITAGTGSFHD